MAYGGHHLSDVVFACFFAVMIVAVGRRWLLGGELKP
jgi:hypothetical protein